MTDPLLATRGRAAVDRLRGRFDARGLVWVNRISGAIIAGFGLAALLSLRGRTS